MNDDNRSGDCLQEQSDELENLRDRQRKAHLVHRQHQREFFLKKVRSLQDDKTLGNITNCSIKSLATMLKSKSQLSCELLNAVMNSLLESKENITEFLSVDGALQALLRALSGQNEMHQLIAARCICNLALGSSKQSFQVLKASESYLMVHLIGKNTYIKEPCAIALGNFSRHSAKHISLLQKQNFFPKIISLLQDCNSDVQLSAIYALSQMIYFGFDVVEEEHINNTLLAILPIFKATCPSPVAFVMSVITSNQIYLKNLHFSHESCQIHILALEALQICLKEDKNEALYYLRIFTNCILEESGEMSKNLIENHSAVLKECIKFLLQSEKEYLQKECLNLVGILINHSLILCHSFGMEVFNENHGIIKPVVEVLKKLPDDQL